MSIIWTSGRYVGMIFNINSTIWYIIMPRPCLNVPHYYLIIGNNSLRQNHKYKITLWNINRQCKYLMRALYHRPGIHYNAVLDFNGQFPRRLLLSSLELQQGALLFCDASVSSFKYIKNKYILKDRRRQTNSGFWESFYSVNTCE